MGLFGGSESSSSGGGWVSQVLSVADGLGNIIQKNGNLIGAKVRVVEEEERATAAAAMRNKIILISVVGIILIFATAFVLIPAVKK